MELSFNEKITSKLQNYSFKLNWICLPVKNYNVFFFFFFFLILILFYFIL